MEAAADCAVFLTGRKNLKLETTRHDAVFSEAYLLTSLEHLCGFFHLLFIYLWFLLVQASRTVLYSNVNLHYLFLISSYWDDFIFWCMQIQTVVFKPLPTTCTVRNVLGSPCSVLQDYSAECVCPLWSPPAIPVHIVQVSCHVPCLIFPSFLYQICG